VPGVTLLQLLDFAAQAKFDGFDATGYYFPGSRDIEAVCACFAPV